MSITKKNTIKKALTKKRSTVFVVETRIAPEETLFPEKLAMANEILRKTKFKDPRIG